MKREPEAIIDQWGFDTTWVVEEFSEAEKGEVDGQFIIGRAEGPMFVPEGESRNNRYYPKKLWDRVLKDPEVVESLSSRLMYGRIGHVTRPVSDDDLNEGRVSHIVSKLWIDEESGLGMGECLIMGTPAGKNLLTYLKAGSKLFTSSRASGVVSNEERDGVPVVNIDTYKLETFDFVRKPGFTQAQPSLVEDENKKTGDDNMDGIHEEMFNELRESRNSLQTELSEARTQIGGLQKDVETLTNKKEALSEDSGLLGQVCEALGVEKDQILSILAGVNKEMLEQIKASENVLNQLPVWKELGLSEDAEEAKAEMTLLTSYKELGTPDKINEALDKAQTRLEQYQAIGTPERISEALDKALSTLETQKSSRVKAEQDALVESLVEETSAPVEKISKMVAAGMNEDDIRAILENQSSDDDPKNRPPSRKPINEREDDDEPKEFAFLSESSLTGRMFGRQLRTVND